MLCGSVSLAWMSEIAHMLGSTEEGGLACDWRLVALGRSTLVLLFALVLALSAGVRLVFWKPRILWVRSLAGSVALVTNFYALSCLSAPEVLALSNTFPIWVAVLSWPLLHEPPTAAVWLAALCGVGGVFLMQVPYFQGEALSVFRGVGVESLTFLKFLAVPLALLGAMASAIAMLGLHRLRDVGASAIVVHFSIVAVATMIGVSFVGRPMPWHQVQTPTIALLLVAVGLAAVIGQLCLTRAFATGRPAKVAVVALSQPIFALVIGLLFRPPEFHPSTLAGIALVLAPTAWVMSARTGE
jgi:drug/metabolite transporter (DMT)-like permease